jgi:hypothetical protein
MVWPTCSTSLPAPRPSPPPLPPRRRSPSRAPPAPRPTPPYTRPGRATPHHAHPEAYPHTSMASHSALVAPLAQRPPGASPLRWYPGIGPMLDSGRQSALVRQRDGSALRPPLARNRGVFFIASHTGWGAPHPTPGTKTGPTLGPTGRPLATARSGLRGGLTRSPNETLGYSLERCADTLCFPPAGLERSKSQ